jgi:hypothetical protein
VERREESTELGRYGFLHKRGGMSVSAFRDTGFESGEAAESGPVQFGPTPRFGRNEAIMQKARERHRNLDAPGRSE